MEKIRELVSGHIDSEVISIDILHGGMSNYNYIVQTTDKRYVVRVPGENAEKFVDRTIEQYHLSLIEELEVNQKVIYFDVVSGVKISEYIEGDNLGESKVEVNEISELFKKYHKVVSNYDYNPFLRLEKYESYLTNQDDKYFQLKKQFMAYKDDLLSIDKVFCHNDSQPLNMIKVDQKIYLLDWEYAGNNDPMYDIVCFCEDFGADSSFAKELICDYFGSYTKDLEKRQLLWTVFQSLQWYNVALFKDNEGMSEKLNINFLEVCDYFLETSKEKLNELRRIENES